MPVLGVIADTHIPDRARGLNPQVLPAFARAGVAMILHAGDVCVPQVLDELARVAPVYAVRGNRDWVRLRRLPPTRLFQLGPIRLGLAHGHGGLGGYLVEKVVQARRGYDPAFYQQGLFGLFPQADVIVFGHSHKAVIEWVDGRLLFNPGSACCPSAPGETPNIGLLYIEDGSGAKPPVRAELLPIGPPRL
jgi:hypothetical protein